MSIFSDVSERVNITDVFNRYGIEINGHGKASCPFHSEKTASVSFKNNHFKCFGCGAYGDPIDFVSKYFNLTSLEAAQKLNGDFGLGVNLARRDDLSVNSEYEKNKRRKEAFDKWELKVYIQLCERRHEINDIIRQHKPASPEQEPDKEFTDALNRISYLDYLLDVFGLGTYADKLKMFVENRDEVMRIAAGTTKTSTNI